jgi:predicted acylesterase/phospholipase RssA
MMADQPTPAATPPARPKRVVLVLQGGGALGAYQAGVYQALHEAGISPDWVIGTSIGAINAALIAGNAPANRLARMQEFWKRVEHDPVVSAFGAVPWIGPQLASMATMAAGLPAFFRPNPLAFLGPNWQLGAERAAYYSTDALRDTLTELIDFDRINAGPCRLTVGAANVRTAEMRYFDSRDMPLDVRHVMASGALPPGFPAVRIDGELYWDGGILSNTPVEAVFDDYPRYSSVIFAVHIWNPSGPEPDAATGDEPHEGRAVQQPRAQPRGSAEGIASVAPHHLGAGGASAAGGARAARGRGDGRLWLPDPDACRASARTGPGGGDAPEGHRFKPRRHRRTLEGRLSAYERSGGAGALDPDGRPVGGADPA